MLDLNFIESVTERDIDLLVLEELSVNERFRKWFSKTVFGKPVYNSKLGTWHSVSDNLGESDLIFLFVSDNDSRLAILIENKIDAPPMPKQGDRYRQRGKEGIKNGLWEGFKTCIIAPSKYISSTKNPEAYDVEVSYEEIRSYFLSRSDYDSRFTYKAKMIFEGIEKNRKGYQLKTDEKMTNFVKHYYAFANENYPALNIQDATPKPAGAN